MSGLPDMVPSFHTPHDDIVEQCHYTVLQCAFDLPVVSLGRKLQTVVVVCIFLLTEGNFTFVCIIQRSPSHQDTKEVPLYISVTVYGTSLYNVIL